MAFYLPPGDIPFGAPCGTTLFEGVPAYSNGSDYFFSGDRNVTEEGVCTGLKWQCVEFARRFLLHRKGLWIPDVAWAAHIFSMTEVIDAVTADKVRAVSVTNGGTELPPPGALPCLAWPCPAAVGQGREGWLVMASARRGPPGRRRWPE